VPHLVEALSSLSSRVSLLLVYGGYDDEALADVERMVRKEEVAERVRFVGAVDESDLVDYYNAADACVFPSIAEGFGIVALEAMACRAPVIGTTKHAAAGHLVHGETGMVAETSSTDSLVENVEKVLSDADLASRIAETGRERVLEQYTWNRLGDTLAAVYTASGCSTA
jgi:glycosyltransferase involved in cell wall biosynthesis